MLIPTTVRLAEKRGEEAALHVLQIDAAAPKHLSEVREHFFCRLRTWPKLRQASKIQVCILMMVGTWRHAKLGLVVVDKG